MRSDPTLSEVPSVSLETAPDSEPLMALNTARKAWVKPPGIPHADGATTRSRPGWVERQPQRFNAASMSAPAHRHGSVGTQHRQPASGFEPSRPYIICHECYEEGHISPDCILPLRERTKVVANYERLTPEQRASVPATSYHRVCAILRPLPGESSASRSPARSQMFMEEPTAATSDSKKE